VHFADGNPDMGRKVFQPELTELADELSRRAVGIFRRYLTLMRPDTGVAVVPATRELFNWKVQQLRFRDENPLSLKADGRSVSVISRPQQEQDVIALFTSF